MAISQKKMTQITISSPVEQAGGEFNQQELKDGNWFYKMTTWVETDKRIKKGVTLTLKDDERVWVVETVYDNEIPFSQIDHHGWDNNNYDKHEGLKLT